MRRTSMRQRQLALPICCLSFLGTACGGADHPSGSSPSDPACEAATCSEAFPGAADAASEAALIATRAPDSTDAARPDASGCVPEAGADQPDDGFVDSNCDGIDGDAAHAIFVAPSGDDSASGTMAAPVRTMGHAVVLAEASGKDVYACNATYAEGVTLTSAVSLYGGYDCAHGWRRLDDVVVLAPPAAMEPAPDVDAGESAQDGGSTAIAGVALLLEGIAQAVTIDHVRLVAADAALPGGSSIASIIVNCPAVTLHQVAMQAGAGADGAPGEPIAPVTTPATTGAGGGSGLGAWTWSTSELSDPTVTAACYQSGFIPAGGKSNPYFVPSCEGRGGQGGSNGSAGSAGAPNITLGGRGGVAYPPSPATPGMPGSPGSPGSAAPANAGASYSVGTFGVSGYAPTNTGADGTTGAPGGGGGGGASDSAPVCNRELPQPPTVWAAGGGGEGGYGGCGGAGGHGGGGGGGSIGLLSVGSVVSFSTGSVSTGAGGRGGTPSTGAAGQPGGPGGVGGQDLSACAGSPPTLTGGQFPGAPGGAGGPGGPGGPGGGGPSLGLVTVGATVTTTSAVFNVGAGGKGGAALSGPNGPDGLSESSFAASSVDAGSPGDGG